MAGKKGAGESSKKVQGQSRKAEQAAKKSAAEESKKAEAEDAEWEKGAKKGNAKKANAEEKKAEAARKKAEREALLAEEEKNTPGRSAPKNAKTATKKTRGIDQALGEAEDGPLTTLNASGIDDAFDALGLATGTSKVKLERRPGERREAAWEKFLERRMKELKDEGHFKLKGNNYTKTIKDLRMEFRKSDENPINQPHVKFNATKEEIAEMQAEYDAETERRLATKS